MTPSPPDPGAPDARDPLPEDTGAGMPDTSESEDLSQLSYEQARDELVAAVQKLENGGVPLAESLALWERSEKLAAICQQRLEGAKQRVQAARESDHRFDAGGTEDRPS
jgi:exodeoxyribonuclease VII small subunit